MQGKLFQKVFPDFTIRGDESMSDMSFILDIIIIGAGIYMLYGAWKLRKGEILANILLPRDASPNSINDKEGFIKTIFTKLLVLSIVTFLSGIIILINDTLKLSVWINAAAYVALFTALIVYGIAIKKAHRDYL